jgi:4-hydroxyphenylpyruvate dioxygenase-like putative hemolysin
MKSKRTSRISSVIQQNNIRIALTSATHPDDVEFFEYFKKHGDQSIQDIAFHVDEVSHDHILLF